MRIAFFVNRFPALTETFILNQITGLLDRGHEVDIYAFKTDHTEKVHADITKYNLLVRTHYIREMPPDKLWKLIITICRILKHYKGLKILLNAIKYSMYYERKIIIKALYAIVSIKGSGHYDIIHCQFGPNGILGIVLRDIGVIRGKIITSFLGYDITKNVKKYGKKVYKDLFVKGDLFLSIVEKWKLRLIELGCDEKKIVVHRLGVDVNKFSFSVRNLRYNGIVRLLTISRLIEKKGIEYAIRAVAEVLKKHPNIEYRIVGYGPLNEQLKGLIKELHVESNIKLLGSKNQGEIIEILTATDILMVPSVTSKQGDQEGTPVVIMEACSQGLPVLGTLHSGIPEIVQDGVSGFLVPEKDVSALAEKLEYLIKYPEVWGKMGRAGREYIEEHFNIDKLNDRLVEIYKNLLTT